MQAGSRGARSALLLVVGFAASRWVVFSCGVRSSAELPQMHMIDRDLLIDDLGRSLLYLHTQPPLFNAFAGLLLEASAARFAWAMSLAYWALGLVLTLAMFGFLRKLGAGETTSFAAALVFAVSPACLLYETFNLYTYPVAVLLVVTSYAVFRYCRSGTAIDAALVALGVTSLALLRGVFHPIWVVAVACVVAWLRKPSRAAALALALPIPLLLVLCAKNAFLFGFFGTSSLLGLNMFRISTELLAPEERLELAERGELSPLALYSVNHPIDHYPARRAVFERRNLVAERSLLPWGWSRRLEGRPEETFLWSDGPWSLLVLPRVARGPLSLDLRCEPFLYPEAPAQRVDVRVNGKAVRSLELAGAVADYTVEIPAELLRESWNLVVFRYRHTRSPRSLGMGKGKDSRDLGVRWLRIEASRPFVGSVFDEEPLARLPRGVPVLDRVSKLEGGPNLNHRLFPAVMEVYRRDAVTAIRESPRSYLGAVARAALIFAAPPTEHPTFRHKRPMIERWDRLYSRFFYGAAPGTDDWPREHSHKSRWLPARDLVERVSWLSLALAVVALPLALVRALRDPKQPANAAVAFMLFNLVYVTLVTNLCELGENNRFRMEVEPIFWVVVVWALAGAARPALGRRARPSRAGESPARDVTRAALQCTTTFWL